MTDVDFRYTKKDEAAEQRAQELFMQAVPEEWYNTSGRVLDEVPFTLAERDWIILYGTVFVRLQQMEADPPTRIMAFLGMDDGALEATQSIVDNLVHALQHHANPAIGEGPVQDRDITVTMPVGLMVAAVAALTRARCDVEVLPEEEKTRGVAAPELIATFTRIKPMMNDVRPGFGAGLD